MCSQSYCESPNSQLLHSIAWEMLICYNHYYYNDIRQIVITSSLRGIYFGLDS